MFLYAVCKPHTKGCRGRSIKYLPWSPASWGDARQLAGAVDAAPHNGGTIAPSTGNAHHLREGKHIMPRLILIGLLLGVGLLGCTYRPAVKPLSPEFAEQARTTRFPVLFRNWLTENDEVRNRVVYYPHDHWKAKSGGDLVYGIPYEGVADTVRSELAKLINVYCQSNGFGEAGPVTFPTSTDGSIEGEGCIAAKDKIAAGYAFQASYGSAPYTLRIYGESPTSAAMARARKIDQEAAEFRREQERKRLQEETERIRSAPRLNEVVKVNLAGEWRVKGIPGYELMHPAVANTGAIFTGRVRDIKPPMVLVETSYFSNGGAVWVPMGTLEASREQ